MCDRGTSGSEPKGSLVGRPLTRTVVTVRTVDQGPVASLGTRGSSVRHVERAVGDRPVLGPTARGPPPRHRVAPPPLGLYIPPPTPPWWVTKGTPYPDSPSSSLVPRFVQNDCSRRPSQDVPLLPPKVTKTMIPRTSFHPE